MNRETKLIMVAILCVAVLGLTVAYSALSATLKVSGTGSVTAGTWDVKFTAATGAKSGSATCNNPTLSNTSITNVSPTFVKPGDSCTYTITVKNNGTIPATLTGITPATPAISLSGADSTTVNGKIDYELTYGGKKVSSGTTGLTTALAAADTTTITMKITFNSTATAVPATAVTVTIPETTFSYAAA